jgi:hypothetical protein
LRRKDAQHAGDTAPLITSRRHDFEESCAIAATNSVNYVVKQIYHSACFFHYDEVIEVIIISD